MKVLTKNPVLVNGNNVTPKDYYSNATADVDVQVDYSPEEEITAGDIKVLTTYPVILDGTDVSPRDYYSNVNGDKKKKKKVQDPAIDTLASEAQKAQKSGGQPSESAKNTAKQKGLFWDNLKKNWNSFTQSDTGKMALAQIDAAITARREAKFGSGQGGAYIPETTAPVEESKPMSTTTKVLLIGGGLVVVGLIIYSIYSGKTSTPIKK